MILAKEAIMMGLPLTIESNEYVAKVNS